MALEGKALDQLTAEDILFLFTNKIRERRTLDYQEGSSRQLPWRRR